MAPQPDCCYPSAMELSDGGEQQVAVLPPLALQLAKVTVSCVQVVELGVHMLRLAVQPVVKVMAVVCS